MTTYLLDVFTRKNETLMSQLIREASSEDKDELSRMDWQIERSDWDVNMSDLIGVAIYTQNMENLVKYEDGIAFYSGDEVVDKIEKLMFLAENNRHTFCGWEIKTYVIPVIYRAFILAGKDISVLDRVFNVYPFENRDTIDLSNLYNFNGQMNTVRARNRYSLEETAYAYGESGALEEHIDNSVESVLRRRIELQKYLFELRGLLWV